MTTRSLGPHYRITHPLNVHNIKGDPYSSSLINIENTYIMEMMSKLRNGDFTFDGWYKFKYNEDNHSLDLILFEPVDEVTNNEVLIMRMSKNEIVI